jgi:hypothetical protein
MLNGRLFVIALSSVAVLAGCGGGSASTRTHGTRFEVSPSLVTARGGDSLGVAEPEIQVAPGGKKKLTSAEARQLFEHVRKFVIAHCPCTYEETSNGVRLLEARHR